MTIEQEQRWWSKITRDLVLLVAGLVLLIFEAVIRSQPPRESLLVLYAGMMGLPAVLRYDENRRKRKPKGER